MAISSPASLTEPQSKSHQKLMSRLEHITEKNKLISDLLGVIIL